MNFTTAREVADALLYEGYLLYPYRANAQKNQLRWQFGVLVPPAYALVDPSEASVARIECIGAAGDDAVVHVVVRFLHVQHRAVEAAQPAPGGSAEVAGPTPEDAVARPWDEAVERELAWALPLGRLLDGAGAEQPFAFPAGCDEEELPGLAGRAPARVVRTRAELAGVVRVRATRLPGPYRALRLHVSVENLTGGSPPAHDRESALRGSLVATHTMLGLDGGAFLSMVDPPMWAAPFVADCVNVGAWPVLAGEGGRDDVVLAAPIVLYDHPAIAPESAGDLYDSTEIDEILSLRTMALTDAEKRQARATDARAAAVIDRVDAMPGEVLDRLHGAVRYLRAVAGPAASTPDDARPPWWDPGADASVSPETDSVQVRGVTLSRGSRVVLAPRGRGADAQDIFLVGRTATVAAVLFDVDGGTHLALTPDPDPAGEPPPAHGRFLYFAPDEVLPLEVGP